MAYVNHGTKVSIPSEKIPAGFTAPPVTPFADAKYKPSYKLTIAKAAVETSNQANTLLAIIKNVTVGIEKQIEDDLTADFMAGTNPDDVNVWIDFRNITGNQKVGIGSDFYNDDAVEYYVDVVAHIKLTP